jgi:hypothetical protein
MGRTRAYGLSYNLAQQERENGMGKCAAGLLGVAGCAAAILLGAGARVWADGAVAVGSTGDVVRDGIAFGMVVNEPKETAANTALQRCRTFKARAAAERCEVVATFSGECFAVAYDPEPGTPGAGWGVGPNQDSANRKAVAMCEETAGPKRRGFCQVETGGCDGAAQIGVEAADPWSDVRETLTKDNQGWFRLDLPLLLLVAGTIGGIAIVIGMAARGKSKAAAEGKPAKEKAKRAHR